MEQYQAILELKKLYSSPCSVSIIDYWLMKHSDLRKDSKFDPSCFCGASSNSCSCFKSPCICFYYLPCTCALSSKKNKSITLFMNIFDKLDELAQLHKYENYFEKELFQYSLISNNNQKVKDWIIKNELLVEEKFSTFFIYNQENDLEYPGALEIYFYEDASFKFYVNHNDFLNTIKFLKIFDDLFHSKKAT